ncbi:MAG: U32 family peptidase [Syntrophomonadaceae bacterium]|nr:U32 family peptidase [Syntrophomonadaceae bacterium]
MKYPELVLPAGSLEKLKTALLFGADAVYLGGKEFSLRAYAGNFDENDMAAGIEFAHQHNKKAYITINILAHNEDMKKLPAYLEKIEELKGDGLIISDLGVLRIVKKYAPKLAVTISTQANISNYEAAAFCRDLGARRVVLARELTLEEIAEVKDKVDIEVEVFVHGAMCVAYSGRCLLSHYMTGRSANRGACAHPCRYSYALLEEKRPGQYFPIEEDDRGSYILNSRDLCLLEYIPELMSVGIDAFKVEGRMKSPLYVGSVASVYRQAIDMYNKGPNPYESEQLQHWMAELQKTAARPFTNGFMMGDSPILQDIDKSQDQEPRAEFCGMAVAYHEDLRMICVQQRSNFGPGDQLEFMLPDGGIIALQLDALFDEELNPLDRARHPWQKVYFSFAHPLPDYTILRRVEKCN